MAGFRKAKPEQAYSKLGLFGPTGSGKTFTALLLAEGLAKREGKRVAYIDTERGTDFYSQKVPERKVHPEAFDFDALYSRSLTEAADAIYSLDPNVYGVVVPDSVTHWWDAAKNAYDGPVSPTGGIPIQAWNKIKRPYKDLIAFLMSAPMHVIICGREASEYQEDEETGELKQVGKKMKCEGETPYEPHMLIRMETQKNKSGYHYFAVVEKDRSGILAGQTIENPCFENICKPILPLLGKSQAKIPSEDEVATKDATALADKESAKAKISATYKEDFEAKFTLAKTVKDLDEISKQLTPAVKKMMSVADVSYLREVYHKRHEILTRPDAA